MLGKVITGQRLAKLGRRRSMALGCWNREHRGEAKRGHAFEQTLVTILLHSRIRVRNQGSDGMSDG
jgi:hypothetical protein